MLYTPNYDVPTSAYCGPAAMAAVTGESIAAMHQAVRTVRGGAGNAKPVKGIYNPELVDAMVQLGWQVVETGDWRMAFWRQGRCLRLGEFLDERGHDGPFIVSTSRHYFAVSDGAICDNWLRAPQEISRFHRKRLGRQCSVRAWWRFEYVGYADDYYDDSDSPGAELVHDNGKDDQAL